MLHAIVKITSNVHISEFLSEMAETIMGDLEESRCIKINDEEHTIVREDEILAIIEK